MISILSTTSLSVKSSSNSHLYSNWNRSENCSGRRAPARNGVSASPDQQDHSLCSMARTHWRKRSLTSMGCFERSTRPRPAGTGCYTCFFWWHSFARLQDVSSSSASAQGRAIKAEEYVMPVAEVWKILKHRDDTIYLTYRTLKNFSWVFYWQRLNVPGFRSRSFSAYWSWTWPASPARSPKWAILAFWGHFLMGFSEIFQKPHGEIGGGTKFRV